MSFTHGTPLYIDGRVYPNEKERITSSITIILRLLNFL